MTAMYVEPISTDEEISEGVIDLFSGVWVCDDHRTKMHAGQPCAFCAVELNGLSVLDKLAQFLG